MTSVACAHVRRAQAAGAPRRQHRDPRLPPGVRDLALGRQPDGALLVLPLLGFEPVDSIRVRSTIDAIARELSAGGPLLYRYPPDHDGLPGREGAFLACS